MTKTEEINLIYDFVHKDFKKVTRKGKAILWRSTRFILIKDIPEEDYKHLLFLVFLETISKKSSINQTQGRHPHKKN